MSRIAKAALLTAAAGAALSGTAGIAAADAGAKAVAQNSPGILAGNLVQAPVHVPLNLCGDSVSVVGDLNPAFGNACLNDDSERRVVARAHHGKKHHAKKEHGGERRSQH